MARAFEVAPTNHLFCLSLVAGSKGDGHKTNYVCASSRARPSNGWVSGVDLHLFSSVSDQSSNVLGASKKNKVK